ncbi:MAG: HAD family phosphatase [Phycisphaeraceae bacterium]|nr:MAG: HAD family phosphatase [Phycisphaeraceae bacterium]
MDAILFDFDGTLVDTEPLHEEAVRRTLAPLNIPVEEGMTIGLSDEDAVAEAFARAGLSTDEPTIAALCLRKTEWYERLIDGAEIFVYPGAVELVRLSAARLRVAICTAAVLREVTPVMRQIGLEETVRTIVTADDVAKKKPHPDAYELAASRLGVPTSRCIAIEDSVRGVRSAKDAGCFVVGLLQTTARERLTDADVIVDSIGDLTVDRLLEMAEARSL